MGWSNKSDPVCLAYDNVAQHIRYTRARKEYQGLSFYDRGQRLVVRFDPDDTSDKPRIQLWQIYAIESLFGGREYVKTEPTPERPWGLSIKAKTLKKAEPQPPAAIITADNELVYKFPDDHGWRRKALPEACSALSTRQFMGHHFVKARGEPRCPWFASDFITGFNTVTGRIHMTHRVTIDQIEDGIPQWSAIDAGFRKNYVFLEKFFSMREAMTGKPVTVVRSVITEQTSAFEDKVWLALHPDWASAPIPWPHKKEPPFVALVEVARLINNRVTDLAAWQAVADTAWPAFYSNIPMLLTELRRPAHRVMLMAAAETALGRRPLR